MNAKAARKIMDGLREALSFAQGDKTKARVSTFVECHDCGNMVRLEHRCRECRARLTGSTPQRESEP